MAARSTITSSGPGVGTIEKAMKELIRKRLLVGIPGDAPARPQEPGQKGTPPSNALIGYVQEHGDDEKHIPARPFLVPGVEGALPNITEGMHRAAVGALSGKPFEIKAGFEQAGLAAQISVKATMVNGGFAPLSDRTIEARARRRNPDTGRLKQDGRSKDARSFLALRAKGTPDAVLHDAGLAKPLLDTFDLYRSVTYVIKEK